MSLTVTISPDKNGFVENPILMNVVSSSEAYYTVNAGGNDIYSGSGSGSFTVNLAEMLAAVFQPLSPISGNGMLIYLEQADYYISVTVKVSNGEGESDSVSMTAWRGGISKQAFRQLASAGTDIFTERFFNPDANPFFCERGPGWEIAVKETELYPIPFMFRGVNMQVRELTTGKVLTITGIAGKLYGLNLSAIREEFYRNHNVLTNMFAIEISGKMVCRICISAGRTAPERYLLRFTSSLGSRQLMEVVGAASVTREAETDETYLRYDGIVDDFVSARGRVPSRGIISIDTGIKSALEVGLLLDLLASDDVALVGFKAVDIPVIPTVDDMTYRHLPTAPESFVLKLTPVEYDSQVSLSALAESYRYPDIFSDEFNDNFN